jgi:UDP-glucose 4-epimerase
MRLLVTGGAGYIGSVVTAHLLEAGHDVVVYDDLSTGHRDGVPSGAELVVGDIRDAAAVRKLMSRGFDGVLHFAAKSLVGESGTNPGLYFDNNVSGTLVLLEEMRSAGIERLVFSSTAATYGEPAQVPILESAPTDPTNAYGASKLAVDLMIAAFVRTYGLSAVSLRYFNAAGAYGPHGERHLQETHLIPLVLQVALGQRDTVSIFGTDYPTPDGTALRDYVHVSDLASAHLLAIENPRAGEHSIYNLGNGTPYSVREVIDVVHEVTGVDLPVREEPRRAGDPAVLVASNAKIVQELGWKPEADLRRIVGDAWEFARRTGAAGSR